MRLLLLCFLLYGSILGAVTEQSNNRAALATKAILAIDQQLGLTASELVEISLFIETDFPKYYQNKEYYLSAQKTGLPRSLEYDPETGYRFIHLEAKNIPYLGKGGRKLVSKSILYDVVHPEIVARCQQTVPFDQELHIMKSLHGSKGVVQMRAVTEHEENGIHYYTMFCKLYTPGPISKVICRSRYHFTTSEKIAIAFDLVRGLVALQKQGIIHRDLGHRNCLIHITEKKKDKRRIEVAITDFGWAVHVSKVQGLQAQGHTAYTAPEGITFHRLLSNEYFGIDLFAIGSLLYQIVYDIKPPWLHTNLIKNELPSDIRYRLHVALIQKELEKQNRELMHRISRMKKCGLEEALESIVLQMVNPDPVKRGRADEIYKKLETLMKQRDYIFK